MELVSRNYALTLALSQVGRGNKKPSCSPSPLVGEGAGG
jgi:hypothetical protein